ncbi:MAG: HEAT repeat domain-containing protein [Candidatus Sericytochromatia bacterium]
MTEDKEPLSHWLGELLDSDPKRRREALQQLGQQEPLGVVAVPALVRYIGRFGPSDEPPAYEVAQMLDRIGPDAIPKVMECLGDQDPQLRKAAARSLGLLSLAAVDALPDMQLAAKKEKDPEVREEIEIAIDYIEGDIAATAE